MNFDILNNKPLEFFNESGELMGKIFISGSTGDLFIAPVSGTNGDVVLGDRNTVGNVEIGLPSAETTLKLMGGGLISANGQTLTIGDSTAGDQLIFGVPITASNVQSSSFAVTASHLIGGGGGSVPAGTVSGSAQIALLGFVSSSITSSMSVFSASNAVTASHALNPGTTVVANPGSSGDGALSTVTIGAQNFSVGGGGGGSSVFTASNGYQQTINNLIISESNASSSLSVINSGSTIFDVQGSVGQLFEVQDGLDGVLMSVNDISGIPILTVSSSGDVILAEGSTLQGTAATASFVPGASAAFPFAGAGVITGSLDITGSGDDIFKVRSQSGSLFSVDDGLDGILMSVNDISGLPLFEVSSSGNVLLHGDISGSIASTASFGKIFVNGTDVSSSLGGGGGGGGSVPSGTVSGSAQITELGFVTSSATASFVTNTETGSFLTNASTSSFNNLAISDFEGNEIPGNGSTSSIAVTVDGNQKFVLDGTVTASISLTAGNAYRFDQSDNTNNNHPIAFKISGSSDNYTTSVSASGTPGNAAASTLISVTNATPNLTYYCTVHGTGMGGDGKGVLTIITGSLIQNGFLEVSGSTRLSGSLDVLKAVTASFFKGDGSALNNLPASDPFPFTGSAIISGSLIVTSSNNGTPFTIDGSGSTLFEVIGSEGTIFSLDDDLDGELFTVNDRSGIPQLLVSSSGRIEAEEGEAVIRSQRPIVTVATNPFTASANTSGKYFRVGGNITCSIFVTASAHCPIGAEFDFFQTSSVGNMLFETASGVTINSKNSNLNLAGQFSSATLKYVNNDEWDLMGDLT